MKLQNNVGRKKKFSDVLSETKFGPFRTYLTVIFNLNFCFQVVFNLKIHENSVPPADELPMSGRVIIFDLETTGVGLNDGYFQVEFNLNHKFRDFNLNISSCIHSYSRRHFLHIVQIRFQLEFPTFST